VPAADADPTDVGAIAVRRRRRVHTGGGAAVVHTGGGAHGWWLAEWAGGSCVDMVL
jgi:hypothetical protein